MRNACMQHATFRCNTDNSKRLLLACRLYLMAGNDSSNGSACAACLYSIYGCWCTREAQMDCNIVKAFVFNQLIKQLLVSGKWRWAK